MIALYARLNAKIPIFYFLLITGMICVLFASVPEVVNADGNQEEFGHLSLNEKWLGDFDQMRERRIVRILVAHDKVGFFIDQGRYRGVNAELVKVFDQFINRGNKDKILKIDVILLPVSHDQLIPALLDGIGDIGIGSLTDSVDRLENVDFSRPFLTNVKQIVVTNSTIPSLNSLDSLSGRTVHMRKSSRSYQHVSGLNEALIEKGLTPMKIIEMDGDFGDADLLQMVHNGVIDIVVVKDHIARFWGKIYRDIKLYQDIVVSEGEDFSWAFRKNSPELAKAVNNFVEITQKGTELGNIVFEKYFHDNQWTRNAIQLESFDRYQSVVSLFRKYADRYDFDYLMTKAIAYQESELNHKRRSPCGAVGIMQLLPETAADKNVGIPDIDNLEENVHAGHKYLRFIQDRYFSEPEFDHLNTHLFTFAAYNAGPRKILDLRAETKNRGLNPNVWFKNVEVIAAERIGRETVQYVSNIYRYYIAYKLYEEQVDSVKERYISLVENTPVKYGPNGLQENN